MFVLKLIALGCGALKWQEYTSMKSYSACQYKPSLHRDLIPSSGKKKLKKQLVVRKHLNDPSNVYLLRTAKTNFKYLLLTVWLSHNAFVWVVFF